MVRTEYIGTSTDIKKGIISYEGVTTSDGASDGSTLIDTNLTTEFLGAQVIITEGSNKGQTFQIKSTTSSGTITPHKAFSAQVTAGTPYKITGFRPTQYEIGEIDDLPTLNPRRGVASRTRASLLSETGIPQLIHLYGALELNKTLTLAAGENMCTCMFSDGTHLYVGLYTTPGKIVKINLYNFTEVSTVTLNTGEDECTCMFSDGTHLYVGLYTTPGKIVKILIKDFSTVSTLTLSAGNDFCISTFADGTYLYVGLETSPGKIVKINLYNFTEVSTLTLNTGENICHAMTTDSTYLYVGLDTSPGKIVKIDTDNFTEVSTLTLATAENSCYALFHDGTYLYAGLYMYPSKVVKVDPDDLYAISTITLPTNYDRCRSMCSDSTYLYIGLCTTPGKIVKVDIEDFTVVSTITLATGEDECTSIFSDGTYIYSGLITSPGKIIRRYIIPTNATLRERKIDRIHERIVDWEVGIAPACPQLNEWWTAAAIDATVWTTATNGAGTVNNPAAEATGMRYVKLDAGVVAGDYGVLSGNTVYRVMPTETNGFSTRMIPRAVILEWEAKLSLGGGTAGYDNTTCIMGFTEEQAENRSSNDCLGFVIGDAAAANPDIMYVLTDNGGTETETSINSYIGASGSLGDYDEWHKYRIYVYNGSTKFYVDEQCVATHTTNLPDIDGYLQFWCEEAGGVNDAEISLGAIRCFYL